MKVANKVALNTVILYVKLVLGVLISLYSVRLILKALGADDYGIYDVVAGVINLLGFVSASLSMTSTRFISVSIGEGIPEKTQKTFKACFALHFLIAVALVLLLQIVFLFVFDELTISATRLSSAKWIYQFMLLTLFLNVVVTPFTALIISHEHFLYVSIIGIVESLLKLGVAFVISSYHSDRLVLYGALMAAIAVFDVLSYIIFCAIKYRQDMSVGVCSVKELKGVSGFASWTLLDVLGTVIPRQGYAVLLNKFFGTMVNAVFALARQMEGVIYTLSASVIDSMKPQIMKSYGQGDVQRMLRLSMLAGRLGFFMMSIIAIPLLVMMPAVLTWWLGDFPNDTILYTRLLIVACMINQLTMGLFYANQAIGDIKWFSIVVASIRMLSLPVSLVLFLCGMEAYMAIVVFVICETVASFARVVMLSRQTEFKISSFLKDLSVKVFPPALIAMVVCISLYRISQDIVYSIVVFLCTVFCYVLLCFFIGLSKDERSIVKEMFRSVWIRIRHGQQR